MEINPLLRKIQLTQLEILKVVTEISQRNGIPYFLCGGTLLGAVRHQGFIPWDDDVDMALLRADYDRLIRALARELPEQYWLQTYETDPEYWLPNAKVRKKGTLFREQSQAALPDDKCGVWIDIFPYETCGSMPTALIRLRKYIYQATLISMKKRVLHSAAFSRRYIPGVLLCSLLSKKGVIRLQHAVMTCFPGRKKAIGMASTYSVEKETMPYEWLADTADMTFEDTEFSVPADWDGYLSSLYGDYMTLPPEEQRTGHTVDAASVRL